MSFLKKTITISGHSYSYQDLISGIFKKDGLNKYQEKTLDFCKDWLSGKEFFSISTSGSTGTPKVVSISAKKMKISAAMTLHALGLQASDKALVCLNTSYIAGMMMLVRGMVGGLQININEPVSNPFLNLNPNWEPIDFVALVPMQLTEALTAPESRKKLSGIKSIIIGGAPLSAFLEDEILKLSPDIYETYGMTETVSHIALRRLNGSQRSKYFRVFNEVEIDKDSRDCLMIRSELTDNQWLITNDRVNLIDDKNFEWLGRIDNVINSGGVKFQIETLEKSLYSLLKRLKISRQFIVAGMPHKTLGEAITLILEGEESEELNNLLGSEFPKNLKKYEIPKDILFFKTFDKTPTGKIHRKVIIQKISNQKPGF